MPLSSELVGTFALGASGRLSMSIVAVGRFVGAIVLEGGSRVRMNYNKAARADEMS